jgi:hypothetical protein
MEGDHTDAVKANPVIAAPQGLDGLLLDVVNTT